MKKRFKDTGFGKFCGRVINKFPDLASDVVDIVTSGNPSGVAIKKVGDLLSTKALNEEQAQKDLEELKKFRHQWEQDMYKLKIEGFFWEVKDRHSARLAFVDGTGRLANEVGRTIISRNLIYIFILLLCQAVCAILTVMLTLNLISQTETAVAVGTGIGSTIGTAIGTVIGSLLQERQQVVGFLFGSSIKD